MELKLITVAVKLPAHLEALIASVFVFIYISPQKFTRLTPNVNSPSPIHHGTHMHLESHSPKHLGIV